MKQIKEFKQREGEQILAQIEGDAFNDSANPIQKLFAMISRVICFVLGIKIRTYIIATNQRVVQINKKTLFWGLLPNDVSVFTLNINSIQTVGYKTGVSWLFFKAHWFVLANVSGIISLTFRGSKQDLISACDIIDDLVIKYCSK